MLTVAKEDGPTVVDERPAGRGTGFFDSFDKDDESAEEDVETDLALSFGSSVSLNSDKFNFG